MVRLKGSLVERAHKILYESEAPKILWGEAILTVNYVIKSGPTTVFDKITPAEIWFGKRPNVSNLKIFGSIAYSYVPKKKRLKLDNKAEKCVMIGYSTNGYHLWNLERNKLILARDAKFNKKLFGFKQDTIEIKVRENLTDIEECEQIVDDKSPDLETQRNENDQTLNSENKRQIKLSSKFDDYEIYMAYNAMNLIEDQEMIMI